MRVCVPAGNGQRGCECGYGAKQALSGGTRCAAPGCGRYSHPKKIEGLDTPRVRVVVALGPCGGGTSGGAGMIHRGARARLRPFACITLIEKEAGDERGPKKPRPRAPAGSRCAWV